MPHIRGTVVVVAVLTMVVAGVAPADAAGLRPGAVSAQTGDGASPAPVPATMGTYPPDRFAAEAAALPPALSVAISRDLGQTPEEYLAAAAAAADAGAVVDALASAGVDVVSSQLDGTSLELTVASPADVAAARATGAEVSVGTSPAESPRLQLNASAALLGGTAYGYRTTPDGGGVRCSIGFNGSQISTGARQFATAGHCVQASPQPLSRMTQIVQSRANDPAATLGAVIGDPVAGSFQYGGTVDSGLIAVTGPTFTPVPAISTWGGAQGAPAASSLSIRGDTVGVVGSVMCKSGSSSGWTCGHILDVDEDVLVGGQEVNSIVTDACVLEGDSGGAAVVGALALGTTSGSSRTTTCGSGQLAAFFPVRSVASTSVESRHPDWELSVAVSAPKPALASGAALFASSPFTGTVPGGGAQLTVSTYYDGRSDAAGPNSSATVSASGSWSLRPPTAAGTHSYRLVARWGKRSAATATGTLQVAAAPTVARIAGSDRFETSVRISKAGFPGTAPVVVVASGSSFPDALGAAPAAVKLGGPLLLTAPGFVPASVTAEIKRLHPARIVVVGGSSAVAPAVTSALARLAPVTRVSGADRYATSRAVASYAFRSAARVYVATGTNFPDALSAGAVAGAHADPVLLVPGYASGVDSETSALIRRLSATSIAVVGGPASVSAALASALGTVAPVTRLAGSDRFATARAVNADGFATSGAVFVASGLAFPDALAGAALAGLRSAPLYVTPTGCVAQDVAREARRLGATSVTLLGGEAALTRGVASLSMCL